MPWRAFRRFAQGRPALRSQCPTPGITVPLANKLGVSDTTTGNLTPAEQPRRRGKRDEGLSGRKSTARTRPNAPWSVTSLRTTGMPINRLAIVYSRRCVSSKAGDEKKCVPCGNRMDLLHAILNTGSGRAVRLFRCELRLRSQLYGFDATPSR
jgi:hypothetical protein